MKKLIIVGIVSVGTLLASATNINNNSQYANSSADNNAVQSASTTNTIKRVCDGINITTSCDVDGVNYKTFIYHPAVPEKSHTETIVTYQEKVVGYCTLCNDGTYSPSCATGRGACSWHGGVAQWNAPRYSKVPIQSTKKVIDAPAREAYYEKVTN